MDNIDQINTDNQLLEPLKQPVQPAVEKDKDISKQGGSQPTEEAGKCKALAGREIKWVWTEFTDKLDKQKVSNGKTATCKHCQKQSYISQQDSIRSNTYEELLALCKFDELYC